MGSELRASSPDPIHRPRPHGFRLVPTDGTADTPSALAPGGGHAARDEPAVTPASRSIWRTIALPLLAVVAIAQGGLLAYWFVAGRAAAEPESGSVTISSDPSGSPVSVDGGVDTSNAARIVAAGAEILVAGQSVCGQPDPASAVRQLRAAASGAVSR